MANRFEPSKTRHQRQKLFYPVGKVWLRPTMQFPVGRVVEIRSGSCIMRIKDLLDSNYFCYPIEAEFDKTIPYTTFSISTQDIGDYLEVPFEYAQAAWNSELRRGIGDPDGLRYFNEKLKQREWNEPISFYSPKS